MYNAHWIFLSILSLFFLPTVQAHEDDSPETLLWVQKTADGLEGRLNDAISTAEISTLLIKLMESYEDFEAVALTGLYCQEVRTAAELGRSYCNWLNTTSQDKDLNALILRAQSARIQAIRMRDAAKDCILTAKPKPAHSSLTLADVIRANADAIVHDWEDGLASEDFHILSQKIEYAERIFHDTDVLATRLNNCETVRKVAREGIQICTDALASQDWAMIKSYFQKVLTCTEKIKERAGECR